MIPIDALTLRYLAAELDVKLADGKVNKIQQSGHYDLLLHIWTGGEAGRQKLYINIHPQYGFLALVEETSFLNFPDPAPNFCTLLRKHLAMARILRVDTLADERVLQIRFENYNELGQRMNWILFVELMGKHSNMILVDAELNMIMACAHGVSQGMSRTREIRVGYPYSPPPKQPKPLIRLSNRETVLYHTAQARQAGVQDPSLAMAACYAGISRATWQDLFIISAGRDDQVWTALQNLFAGHRVTPCIREDRQAFSLLPRYQTDAAWLQAPSVQTIIAQCFLPKLCLDRLDGQRKGFLSILEAQQARMKKRLDELEKTDPQRLAQLRHYGDLLTAAANQDIAMEKSSVEALDWETGNRITIPVNATWSIADNAQDYYRRYKKGRTRQTLADIQRISNGKILEQIESIRHLIINAQSSDDLAAVAEDLTALGWITPTIGASHRKRKKVKPASQPLQLAASDGSTIWVGRNNLQNDLLIRKLSDGCDLWFHAHQMPGSHVVVKTQNKAVSNTTLEEAAMLAAWFSAGRNSVNVPIIYTAIRYVRKIPESYPGHVSYKCEQSLNITPDPQKVDALLSTKI